MDWNYQELPPQHFDVIWASPPCTGYSRAKTAGVRKIDESNAIVLKVLEITQYLDPIFFIIENLQSGLLEDQYFMNDIPYDLIGELMSKMSVNDWIGCYENMLKR
jgi:site-specific DNA-cytosine methylase